MMVGLPLTSLGNSMAFLASVSATSLGNGLFMILSSFLVCASVLMKLDIMTIEVKIRYLIIGLKI
jgi:hypothetical protein